MISNVGDSRAVMGTRDQDGHLTALQLTVDLKPNLPGNSTLSLCLLLPNFPQSSFKSKILKYFEVGVVKWKCGSIDLYILQHWKLVHIGLPVAMLLFIRDI